jgi:predicted HicB family RNase H-like nuclease
MSKNHNSDRVRKPTRTKRAEPLVPFVLRLPAEIKAEIEKVAAEQGESVNTVIRVALRRYLVARD